MFDISRQFTLRYTGESALWTNPAFKAERITYSIPTISGLRGLFRSIWGKPETEVIIDRVGIRKPILTHTVGGMQEVKGYGRVKESKQGASHTLRNEVVLSDVEYDVTMRLVANPERENQERSVGQYAAWILKYLHQGRQHRQPVFGRSGYPAYWKLIEEPGDCAAIDMDINLLFEQLPTAEGGWDPVFFRAHIVNGVLNVPFSLWEQHLPEIMRGRQARKVARRAC